jgi:ABC-type sugar transport system substrate-binding protein
MRWCALLTFIIFVFGQTFANADPAPKKIAVLLKAKNNAFYDSILDGIQEKAGKYGYAIHTVYGHSEDDWQSQIEFLETEANKYDAIVLVPNRSDKFAGILRSLKENKKPVIILDTPVSAGAEFALTTISSDNKLGGRLAATFMSNQLRIEPTEEKCVILLSGNPEAQTHIDRNQGFLEVMKAKHPEVKIYTYEAMSNFQTAKDITIKNLKQFQRCYGIFAGSDTMILGALDAFESKNLREPAILVGYDAVLEVQRKILESKITGSVQQSPADMARASIESLKAYWEGQSVPAEQMITPRLAVRKFQLDLLGEKELAIVSPKAK